MKTAQPTPGPWTYETDDSCLNAIIWGKGRKHGQHKQHVAQVWSGQERSLEVAEANAALIAAAPDLLAALKAVVAIADRKTDEFDQARAAIAKAEA